MKICYQTRCWDYFGECFLTNIFLLINIVDIFSENFALFNTLKTC